MVEAVIAQTAAGAAARSRVQQGEAVVRNATRILAITFVVLALAFAVFAWLADDSFYFRLATEALIYGGFAMSVDLLLGFTGMLSLGHALFFGLGAYVSALVLKEWANSFWLAMLVVLVAATVTGAVAGLIAIKARGVYFALITFGLAEVVAKAVYNTREIGGSDGLIGIPVVQANFLVFTVDAAKPLAFFLLVLVVIMGMYALLAWLLDTPFGRLMKAVRANESRVPFLGFKAGRVKWVSFVVAANVAALSGALYPMLRGFVSPELFFFQASGNAVITVIIGGLGTLVGPLYGSVLLTGLKSVLGSWTEHHLIVIGILFMLSVIFFPKGLIGYLHPRLTAWLAKRGASQ